MIEHTPGPWRVAEWRCHAKTTILNDDHRVIAECSGNGEHTDTVLADAQLISATPELFEACKKLLRLHYDTAKATAAGLEAVNMAEEAIAKATGHMTSPHPHAKGMRK